MPTLEIVLIVRQLRHTCMGGGRVRDGKQLGGGDNNFPDLDGNCTTDTKLFSVIFLLRGLYTSYMLPSHHFSNLK